MSARILNLGLIDGSRYHGLMPSGVKRVDRRTEFGNPFQVGRDGDRDAVCDKFAAWFHAPEQADLRRRAIFELSGFDLACWCAPLRCHAETIRDWIGSQVDPPYA